MVIGGSFRHFVLFLLGVCAELIFLVVGFLAHIMIKLTSLNNTVLIVNADMIEFLEATPDTVVTLNTGRKVVARESVEDIIEEVVAYKRRWFHFAPDVRNRSNER